MNKQIYRLVFNKARGCLMAVAETATSSGKAASGERVNRGAKKRGGQHGGAGAAAATMQRAMLLGAASLWLAPMHGEAQTVATRIVADPAAARSQQATVVNASNGVVQVNIQTPSNAGVSRNTYTQFDVGSAGAILNNSRTNVQTQLGGWVQANPWLATGAARVILNEVNSGNASQLRGYLEVGGQRAEVVVANPAGIAVNGGGFINASGVTLTTGTAVLNNGALESYRVLGGSVVIDGTGLDTRGADYTAILARAAQVNAGIWANRLQVVTGSNSIQAASLGSDAAPQAERIEGSASVPNYALDVSALGGMYAGKIVLIGTEAGLGVRNAGIVQANSGPLTLTQEGWLANSGTLQANGGDVAVQTRGAIEQSGTVYASGNVQMTSQASQVHSGTVAALGDVNIQAAGDDAHIQAAGGTLWAAGLQTDGQLTGQQNLNVQASAQVQTAGRALATQNLALQGASLDLSQSNQQAVKVQLQALTGDLVASGSQILATDSLQLQTPQAMKTDGAQLQAATIGIQAASLSNVGGQIIQSGAAGQAIALQGRLDNTSGLIQSAADSLTISAQSIDNTAGQLLHSGSGIFSLSSQEFLKSSARIVSSGALQMQAQAFSNSGSVNAASGLEAKADSLDNSGTMYAAGGQALTVSHAVTNSGAIAAGRDLAINAASVAGSSASALAAGMAADGKLTGSGALSINTSGALQNAGQALATGDLTFNAASLDLNGSSTGSTGGNVSLTAQSGDVLTRQADISTPGQLSITANANGRQTLDNTGGQLSGRQLTVKVGQLDNSQGLIQQTGTGTQAASIQAAGALNNSAGSIVANAQELAISAGGSLNNADGLISSVGKLGVSSADLSNTESTPSAAAKGLQSQESSVELNVQALDNSGRIQAAQDLNTHAAALANSGTMYAGGRQTLAVGQAITSSGTIAAGKDLTVNAASLAGAASNVLAAGMTEGGQLSGSGALSVTTTGTMQTAGQALAAGNVNLNAAALDLSGSAAGSVSGDVTLTAHSGEVLTRQAQVSTPGQLAITANTHSSQALDNTAGRLSAQKLNIETGRIDNSQGSMQQTGAADLTIDLHGGAFNNNAGSLTANSANLNLNAGALDNTAGVIGHSGTAQLNVNATVIDNSRGQIVGNGTVSLTDTGNLTNADGAISAHDGLYITGADIANSGSIRAGQNLDTHAASLNNSGSMYAAEGLTLTVDHAVTSSGTIAAGKDLTLNAASLSGGSANLLAAGMAADGKLAGTGALSVTTSGALQTAGQALGAGNVNLNAASLDLNGSSTGSIHGDVTLTARSGDILAHQAQISAPGQLAITANAGKLDNSSGQLSGQQLNIQASLLDNTQGVIQQTGTGTQTANIQSAGGLSNNAGRIVANAQNLTLRAGGALDNTDGQVSHAGTGMLDIASAGLDNTRGQIVGNGAAKLASAGDINNASGLVSAQNGLSLTGGDLANSGNIHAGQDLDTHAASLNNSGTMYAGGAQTLVVDHAITSSGTIAAGQDLTVKAASLAGASASVLAAGMASDGKIAGSGAMSVTTTGALQTAGQALAAGNLDLDGASLDLSGSATGSTSGGVTLTAQSGDVLTRQAQISAPGRLAITANTGKLDNTSGQLSGQQVDIHAGQLDNSQGFIQQTGTQAASIESTGALNNSGGHIVANAQDFTLHAGGALINTDGQISHAGTGALDIAAASLDNARGQIVGNGAAKLASTGDINNASGLISAQDDVTVSGADLANTGTATIQSQTGNVGLTVQALTNSGNIHAAQDLTAHAASANNSGTMYAAGSQTLTASGAVTSSGTIAAGKDLTLNAGSLAGTSANVLAAGMAVDGQLTGIGALSVSTTGALQTSGQALATGNVSLTGASIDASGSTMGSTAGNVALTAQSGNLLTRQAQASTPGTLTITANAGKLDNTSGQLSGQQVDIKVGQLDNSQGAIQQTGSGAQTAHIQSTGALTNTGGRIVANAQDFTLASGALTNTDGLIGHAGAGSLGITAASVDNTRGQITGNGSASLASTGNVVNADGSIATQNDLTVSSADLANTGTASIQSQAGNVGLTVQALTNSGNIHAAQDLNTHAASADNSGTMYAAGDQTLTAGGSVTSSGTIAAGKDLTLNAGSLAGTSANVLAAGMAADGQLTGTGALSATTTGALQTAGHALATGNVNLTGASIDASGSTTGSTAGNVTLTAQSGNLLTRQAQVSTPGMLTITANAGKLDNTSGQLSGQQVDIKVGQLDNSQGAIQQTGSGAQTAHIQSTGALTNTGGRIVANAQDFTLASGALTNTDGLIGHAGAGSLGITAASVDNTRGQITGNGSASLASTGNVVNADGSIAAQNDVTVSGANLSNTGTASIQSQAGNVGLTVQALTNSGNIHAAQDLGTHATSANNSGTMYAAGSQTLTASGAVTSSGTIAAGKDLTVNAGSLAGTSANVLAAGMAADGQLTGTGALSVTTTGALQTAGHALATGNVNLTGASIDASGSTTGSTAGDVTLTAQSGNLLTRQAQVSTPGMLTVTANAGKLDNTSGQLSGQQVDIKVGQLDNSQGAIQQTGAGAQTAHIQSTGALTNTGGRIVANAQDFTLASGALTNTDGLIGHAGAGSLGITAASVDNTRGQITGNGSASLASTGNVVNADGSIAAQNDLTVSSADLANTGTAGIQSQAGNVGLTVQALTNSGNIHAAQDLSTHATSADNSGTMYAAGSQTLAASGAVTSSGTIAAGKDLTVNAGSLAGTSANVLAAGMAADGQLTGTGALSVTTTGALQTAGHALATGNVNLAGASIDASGSTTGSTAGNVALTAQSGNLLTRQAQISTPGLLTITADANAGQLLDNTGGLLSARQLHIEVGQLDNTQGAIQQSGTGVQAASIQTLGAASNNMGRIVANAQDFTLDVGGTLNNVDGLIGHAGTGSLDVAAASVDNTRGQIVGNGATTVASTGAVDNSSGLISAQQTLSASAAGFTNNQGKLVSTQGSLTLHSTQGSLSNTGGLIQAAQDVGLTLDGVGNSLQNGQGKIIAGHNATLSTGAVNNDAGLIASGNDLQIDTHGQSLSNRDGLAGQGSALGLVAGGQLTVNSGALDNEAGLISGQNGVDITSSGAVNNAANNGHASQIYSGGNLNVQATGLDNTGSQILAVQGASIQLGGGQLSNSAGLVRAGQTLSLTAGAIDNTATLSGNTGLEANTINVVTANLDNTQGAVRAGQDLNIHDDGQLTNTQGELSAGRSLLITTNQAATASLALSNTAGKLVADQSVDVRTGSLSGSGSIISQGDVSLDLQGDYTLSGTLQAGANMALHATGSITNPVSVQAGQSLSITAANLDNQAGGELLSGATTTLGISGTLENRGLIDGADTHIQASTVNNAGSGRIYGDCIGIAAGTLSNVEENGSAATIAGRERLDIGAQNLTNREGALLYSAGDLAIGGALDGNWQATGSGQSVNNNSATIEAAQNLSIAASDIRNTNEHFATADQQVSQEFITEYQGSGALQRYASTDPGVYTYTDESLHLHTPDGNYEVWTQYNITRTVNETVVTQSDPGKIIAGGGIRLTGNSILNDKSQIVAGGSISILGGVLNNTAFDGTRTTTDSGTAINYWRVFHKGTDSTGSSSSAYSPGPVTGTFDLRATRFEEFSGVSTGAAPQGSTLSTVQARASAGGAVTAGSSSVNLNNVSGTQAGNASGTGTASSTNRQAQAGAVGSAHAQGGAIAGSTGRQIDENGMSAGQAHGDAIGDDSGRQVSGSVANSAQAQGGAIAGNTGRRIAENTASGAQAQGYAVADSTGHQVSGSTATVALGDAIAATTGRQVSANPANSGQAQGDAAAQQTAGQVQALSGTAAETVNAPDKVAATAGSAQITIRTAQPNFRLPTASLFKIHPESQARYLVETDPKFTQYKSWLSSDYMLDALKTDPAATQKRMGDGFYEQKLVREQVLALTGQRFLGDYRSDDEEYKALMDNGLTYAKQWGLRPGVSLTAEQVSQLTSDIVWLVTQEVQLPDGSKQSVLVPQVYVRVQPGDLDGSGGLLAGKDININLTGDMNNSGSVAGRNLVNISADNIRNQGGSMSAATLALQATKDIDNIGGTMKAQDAALLSAGRDINMTSTTQSSSRTVGANSFAQTGIDRKAGLYVSAPAGILLANAGNNINLTAAQINNAGTGLTQLSAGNNLNLSAVTTSSSQRIVWDSNNHQSQSSSQEVGTQVKGAGNMVLAAGQDINAKAAAVSAGQALNVAAGRDVNLMAGQASESLDEAHKHTSSGFLSKKTITTHDQLQSVTVLGSNLDGASVNLQAGRDVTVQGSSVIADKELAINAQRNLSVLSAEETSKSAHSVEVKKSGLTGGFSSGVASVGYGKSSSSSQSSLETVTQVASSIGSLNGSATLKSGETLKVVASDIAAKENLTLIGKDVDLAAAQNTSEGHESTQSKASGFSVGVTVNPLQAFKDAYKADTKDSKSSGTIGKITSKADGIADGAMAATTAVAVQFGSSSSSSNGNHATSEARSSTLNAGKDLTILATDGSITSQGAQISAEGNALLVAKDSIKFDVAHNTESKSQDSKTSGFSFDNRSALMVGTLHDKGNGSGATDTVTVTKLSVGGSTTMATQTGDITLIGANVASDGKLAISAARDLTITSAQDTARNANQSDNKAIGKVVVSDTERFAGYHNEKHKDNSNEVTQVGSNVGSLNGDVVLSAGEKYTQASSNVLAKNDVSISAKTIDITALENSGSSQSADSALKVGAFARISSPLIDLVNNVEAARKSDGRLQAMQGMAAAAQGYQIGKAVTGDGILIKGEVGVGFASSSSSNNSNGSTAAGSTINGGGNVTLTSTAGDIHATGATLGAGKALSLESAQNIVLDASQSTAHSDGKNNSAGVEVGVGFQAGAKGTGVYAYAAANVGNGHNNSDSTTYSNTQLKADTINITSKGDTTLRGATATANTVNADVGGKLAIESLQDTSRQESSQTNAGARVEFGIGVMNASGNLSQSKTNGSSASVGQQSGLFAGDGGYHVKADTVGLKGGAIASTNTTTSELTANKLTASNLENKMNYSASSVSMAGSISGAEKAGSDEAKPASQQPQSTGQGQLAGQSQLFGSRMSGNVTPGVPMIEKGSDSSTTYATVTDGKITIGGVTTNSVKGLGINNDASKANTGLDKLPDLQKVLKEQQAMSAAAGTVLTTGKQIVGEIASKASNAAIGDQAAAQRVLDDPNSTAEQKAAAKTAFNDAQKAQADWGPGGIYNRALNAGLTVLVGSAAGQGSGQVAANAMGPTVAKTVGDIGSSLAGQALNDVRTYAKLAEEAKAKNDTVAVAEYTEKAKDAVETATNWGDNGIYRVGLHAATQGMLGGLSNGQVGGLESSAGVVGGNLAQHLGAQLGNAEADKLGLTGEKRAALINAYQNTGAVVGGMLAGAAAAVATGQSANGGAILAAGQGGSAAQSVDTFNRQLHDDEKARIHELAKKDLKREGRLLIASCALTKCSAEFPVGSQEYIETKALEDLGNSSAFKEERDLLAVQVGARGKRLFTYDSVNYLGGDVGIDAVKRWNNSNGVTTRIAGGVQFLGGFATGTASGALIAVGGAACPETLGAGCAAAALGWVGAGWSADQMAAGGTTMWTGRWSPTYGGKLVSNILGVSPAMGEMLNGVLGMTPLAADAALSNGIIKIPLAVPKTGKPTSAVDPFLEPEADFAAKMGNVRDKANGTLTEHMVNAELKANGKSVYGGHDMKNFEKIIKDNHGTILSRTETSPGSGIYEVEYTLPNSTKTELKTTYDPVKYPEMPSLVSAAAQKALAEYQLKGYEGAHVFEVNVGGVKFSVPVNPTSKTDPTPKVPTVYPKGIGK